MEGICISTNYTLIVHNITWPVVKECHCNVVLVLTSWDLHLGTFAVAVEQYVAEKNSCMFLCSLDFWKVYQWPSYRALFGVEIMLLLPWKPQN